MFRFGVNCALEDVPTSSPVILRGDIESIAKDAAQIGYDGLELFIRDPKQYDAKKLKTVANKHGLSFCNIATGMEYTKNGLSLISDDISIRKAAIQRLCEHIDLASVLECPVIVGIMRGNIPDMAKYDLYESYLTNALQTLSIYAKQAGVPLVVEAIMRYINNYLNNVPETMDYLNKVGCDNIGIHIDSHLMNVEDKDIKASIYYCQSKLEYVHFSDSNRAYPGGGNFDFKQMMSCLMDVNYTGYITTECQPYPNPYICAKRGFDYMKHLQALLEVERADLMTV